VAIQIQRLARVQLLEPLPRLRIAVVFFPRDLAQRHPFDQHDAPSSFRRPEPGNGVPGTPLPPQREPCERSSVGKCRRA